MSGAQSTSVVQDLVSRIARRWHLGVARAFLDIAGPFPVAGPASWSNDWHVFRPCPWPHLHAGLDMFAPEGTPVVAVANGSISETIDDDVTGLGIKLDDGRGMDYLYAHLSSFAPGIGAGVEVRLGQVLGFVGNTGDAAGATPHLHFQAEPGGIPMPPKPLVDRWLLREEHRARRLLRVGPHPTRVFAVPWGRPTLTDRLMPEGPAEATTKLAATVVRATVSVPRATRVPAAIGGALALLLALGLVVRARPHS
jgi:hypothetical protein